MSTLVFTAQQVCKIVGVPYSTLDYWARHDVIVPDYALAEGKGSKRLYSYRNVIALKVAKLLKDQGISLDRLRNIADFLHEKHEVILEHYEHNKHTLVLITNGQGVYFLTFDEILNKLQEMRTLFWVIPLGQIIEEVDAIIGSDKKLQPLKVG